jgi:serine/threonine protein kinase
MPVNKSNYLGKQVGSYRVVDCLGSGGFADVYLGEHIYLKTQSAIKMLHIQLSKRALQNFLNEAKIIARLEHPNIIHVFDYGVQEGSPFLVMNYAPNGNLRQRYPRGTRLPLEQIIPYIQQAASALDYAHQLNLIHRDVKPANMLIGQQQQLLLSDFGLALAITGSDSQPGINSSISSSDLESDSNMPNSSSDSQSKIPAANSTSDLESDSSMPNSSADSQPKRTTLASDSALEQSMSMIVSDSSPQPKISTAGTIPYMAPEQLLGKACYASDQYALGIIAYEWICGEYPFTGSFMKIASQHVLAMPPSLNARVPNLPQEVEQVVFKALAKDPTQRFATVSDFAQALQLACQTVSSTTVLTNENTSTSFEGKSTQKNNANATGQKTQLTTGITSTGQRVSDSANENDISRNSYTQYNAAKIATSSQPALDTFDPSSDIDMTYSTLKLPAQADITYNTSKLPIHSDITLDTSDMPPNPPSHTAQNIPTQPEKSYKRSLRFALLCAAIIVLVTSGIVLGISWYGYAHKTLAKEPIQRQSTLLHKSTHAASHTTQPGVAAGTTATPIATSPANPVNASTTSATNPLPVSSTPGATSPSIPTPTPVADCIQASLSNITFMSPPNPVVDRSRKLTLTNCGGSGSTNWQASVQSSGWLNVSLNMGSINPGASSTIVVQTNVDGLPAGDYSGSIVFTAGTSSWPITVEYTVK